MQGFLVIGGFGKWSSQTYLPVLFDGLQRFNIEGIVAIADIATSVKDISSYDLLKNLFKHEKFRQIKLTGIFNQDVDILEKFLSEESVDNLIISTHPLLHYPYIKWGIKNGLNIICDKPPVSQFQQFGNTKAEELLKRFNELCICINNSKHHRNEEKCKVFLPLRRRVQPLFKSIYDGIQEVFQLTKQHITHVYIHLNDGSYRFPDEYDLPGAHGYRDGLGSLTHTAYHLIDVIANCLEQAPPPCDYIESKIISCLTVQEARKITNDIGYQNLIGRNINIYNDCSIAFIGDNSEIDIQIAYAFKKLSQQYSDCNVLASFIHRGCTKRIHPYYNQNQTHDEGRVDDTVIIIQQGALQSYHLMISDDAGGAFPNAYIRSVRRLNPKLSSLLGKKELSVDDFYPNSQENKNVYQFMLQELFDIFSGKSDPNSLKSLYLNNQVLSMTLYSLAIDAYQKTKSTLNWRFL
jgi:hypothetical protein